VQVNTTAARLRRRSGKVFLVTGPLAHERQVASQRSDIAHRLINE
jgi:hypothetical protein